MPPRFDELVAHMQRVLPLRYTDERPEEAEEDAPAGSGGVLGIERDGAAVRGAGVDATSVPISMHTL